LDSYTIKQEAARIIEEYARRAREIPTDYYSFFKRDILFSYQRRVQWVIRALRNSGISCLRDRVVLEVGCGRGDWLVDLETWGAQRKNLAGVELHPEKGKEAQARLGDQRDRSGRILSQGSDIRIGDASTLSWPTATFDIVIQSTVFSSILAREMKFAVASEMTRVLKPQGVILWYDLLYNNPKNPNVAGIKSKEIRELFPGFSLHLNRITLAPPIARRLVPISWMGALALEKLMFLNTHYLAILKHF